jgi:hypothetical protein
MKLVAFGEINNFVVQTFFSFEVISWGSNIDIH